VIIKAPGFISRGRLGAQRLGRQPGIRLSLNDLRSDKEDQLLRLRIHGLMFEQVAQNRDASQQWHLSNGKVVLRLHNAANHHSSAIGNQYLRGGLLRVQRRVQLLASNTGEIRNGVLNVHVQEDGVFRCDLRSHAQAQERVNVSDSRRAAQLLIRNHRNACALLDQRQNVVLCDDMRPRENLEQAAALRHCQDEIQAEVGTDVQDLEAAARGACSQVVEERNGLVILRIVNDGWRIVAYIDGALAHRSTNRIVAKAVAEPELRTDIAREGPGGSHHSGFDFHFRSLAIQSLQQLIDFREHTGNIFDDQCIAPRIGDDVSSRRKEFLDDRYRIFGLAITQIPRDGLLGNGQGLRFLLRAARLRLSLQSLERRDAQHVALKLALKTVVVEDNGQRLVPRHIVEHDGDAAFDSRVEHHVQPADLMDYAEEILEVQVFEVHSNRLAGIATAGAIADGGLHDGGRRSSLLLLQSGINGRRLGVQAGAGWKWRTIHRRHSRNIMGEQGGSTVCA